MNNVWVLTYKMEMLGCTMVMTDCTMEMTGYSWATSGCSNEIKTVIRRLLVYFGLAQNVYLYDGDVGLYDGDVGVYPCGDSGELELCGWYDGLIDV